MLVHRLTPLLADQLGLVTRMQALEQGVGARQLHRMVARGDLVVVHRDVLRHPAAPLTKDQRRLAAILAAGPGAALSHRAAADVIGVSRFRSDLVEVTRPSAAIIRLDGVHVHRIPDLSSVDIRRVGELDVTSPARTVVDLGLVARPSFVQRVMEEWLASKLVTFAELEAVLDRVGRHGRNGAGVLRSILADRALGTTVADSVPESALGELLVRHGFPPLTHHHLVVLPSGAVFELDWSYPDRMLGFEVDGYGVHLRSNDAFERDRLRRNELEIHGWRILHFAGTTVLRRPHVVVDQVRRALGRREPVV
ncbi:MAG: type IV toxin-antitoxin system AbiEi family antitoxin domain-containing protein [Acidimicrobiia bacterium]